MFAREDILPCCTCILALLVLPAAYAWLASYKYWRSQIYGTPVPAIYREPQALLWFLRVVVLSLCSVVILWFFSWYIGYFFTRAFN